MSDPLLAQNFYGDLGSPTMAPGEPDEAYRERETTPGMNAFDVAGDIIASPFRGVVGAVESLLEIPGDIGGLFHESLSSFWLLNLTRPVKQVI